MEMRAGYEVDLHCHTTRSDGADSPKELIDHAVQSGLKVIAITDHDIRPPKMIDADGIQMDPVAYAKRFGIALLLGTEISCETAVEDCHLVCLNCDWDHPYFAELEESVIRSKLEGYRLLTSELARQGYPVSWDEVLENGGNPVPEERVQKKMIFELLARKGCFASWSDAKRTISGTEAFQFARCKPDPLQVIEAVHRSGGIAIMAHPYLIREPVQRDGHACSRDHYIRQLIAGGLDGIEACYTYDKTSYGGNLSSREIEAEVRRTYTPLVHLISGGSDYHADAKKGTANFRELGECGLSLQAFLENAYLRGLLDESMLKTITHKGF